MRMKLMMKYGFGYKWIMLVVSMLCASCSTITEFPDENPVDPTLINLNIEIQLAAEVSDMTNTEDFDGVIKQRVVVEAYKFDDVVKPAVRKELLLDDILGKDKANISLSLNATKYRLVVWSDYVQTASPSDLYYYTAETLRNIKYNGEYIANRAEKDCFSAAKDVDLTKYSGVWNLSLDVDMQLKRPVGKLVMISNDVEDFVSRANSRGEEISRTDISSYTAKVTYSGFAPNGFDAYDGVLNDATSGLSYTTKFQLINDNEAMIAFDYMLADEEGTSYEIAMQIFDDEGNKINEVGEIKAVVSADKVTVLKKDFLTGDYNPGISIDTDFDGSIDVVLPD